MFILYLIQGAFFCIVATACLLQSGTVMTRIVNSSFWGAYGVLTITGSFIPVSLAAALFLVLLILPPFVRALPQPVRELSERKMRALHAFFPLALNSIILLSSLILLQLPEVSHYFAAYGSAPTQMAVGGSAIIALVVGVWFTRTKIRNAAYSAERLVGRIGPSLVLPQTLAALGALIGFLLDNHVRTEITAYLSQFSTGEICAFYLSSCFLMTLITGSAFAAFPVSFALFHSTLSADGISPTSFAALGMLSGYCGTLFTPLAANFNIIPAKLLDIEKPADVIWAQIPAALAVLAVCMLQMIL